MDIIFISDLRVDMLIGVYDWERRVPQTVQLDLEIALPGADAAMSDKLSDTIDYAAVVTRIRAMLSETRHQLLESVAEDIAGLVTGEFRSPWVKVTVTKLAPLPGVKRLGVSIERGRRDAVRN